jgi:hypothetical protein
MKYLSLLVVFTVLVFAGSANAQKTTSSGGKSYTYVMKNINGQGQEIIDQINFNGNTVISDRLASTGYKAGNMVQKTSGAGSNQFDVIFKNDSKGTMHYTGTLTEKSIEGTVIVTDASGNKTTMAIRGMPTDDFNIMQKEKSDYQKAQQN